MSKARNLAGFAGSITSNNDLNVGIITATSFVGDVVIGAGSTSAPSLAPTGDSNTGVFFPSADTIALSSGGSERLRVDSSGNINIDSGGVYYDAVNNRLAVGTTSPAVLLDCQGTGSQTIRARTNDTSGFAVGILRAEYAGGGGGTNTNVELRAGDAYSYLVNTTNTPLLFGINGSERARLDSSGRLLVGTSSAQSVSSVGLTPALQLNSSSSSQSGSSLGIFANSATNNCRLALFRNRATTAGGFDYTGGTVQSDDVLGEIEFYGVDGQATPTMRIGASIEAVCESTPTTAEMPSRLVFSTTADGATSPTERMRISSSGTLYQNFELRRDTTNDFNQFANTSLLPSLELYANSGSFANPNFLLTVNRAATSAYQFLVAYSGGAADIEFLLRGDGTGLCDGSWTGGGADYAEYFEWSDSNPDSEDRRGISVVLDGDKIREAVDGEDPIGVISGNPSVVGDAAWNKWSGKYLRDDFGTYVQEDYEVTDEDGNTVIQQRRKLNPAYDPDQPYQSREQRPEWDCVGLMGKLRIRKGQVTGSRWIKMRDISATVEEWLVR